MTASRNKASRAVTAALVGVLSVGAVPMVAVAAESGSGAVTLATDTANIAGGTVSYESGAAGDAYTYTGEAQGLVPTTVTLVDDTTEDVDGLLPSSKADRETGHYYYYYVKISETDSAGLSGKVSYVDADGETVALKGSQVRDSSGFCAPTDAGEYAVVVGRWTEGTGYGTWDYVSTAGYFEIEPASLSGASIYQINDEDEADVSDTTISYEGWADCDTPDNVKSTIGVALDGVALDGDDYTVEIWEVGGSLATTESYLYPGQSYVAHISANSANYTGTANVTFTYEKLDLSAAEVVAVGSGTTAPSVSDLSSIVESVDGNDVNGSDAKVLQHQGDLDVALTGSPDGSDAVDSKGAYEFTVTAKSDSSYYTGSFTVTYVWSDVSADVYYGEENLSNMLDGNTISVNLAEGDSFDLSKISAKYTDNEETKDVPSDCVTVTATDSDGNAVTDLSKAGKYTVTVVVSHETDDGLLVAASETFYVDVTYGTVTQKDNVFFVYDGKNVPDGSVAQDTYDGSDKLDKVSVKVVAGDGTVLTEGTDYTVTVTNEDGEEVDEAVDAGSYTVTVKGLTYEGTAEFTIVVDKLALDHVSVTNAFADHTDEKGSTTYYYVYDDEGVEPEFVFYDEKDGEWSLDADEYEVTYYSDMDMTEEVELGDEGVYYVKVTVSDSSTNFTNPTDAISAEESPLYLDGKAGTTITVTAEDVYADVSTDMNLASEIYKAKDLGYMTGYAGGVIFGYYDNLSRADAVMVLWNMAGNPNSSTEGSYGGQSFYLPYEDCDESAYYAQALQWATNAGIVSGDNNDLTYFRPTESVTREEFAKMLYVYEQIQRNTYEVDADDILSAYADADSVSEWAEQYVAWLVDQGVMGQNTETINGNGDIIRAEVAAMVVRMQPDGKINWSDFIA